MDAVERVAASDPNPGDPFRGLYISDETALRLTRGDSGSDADERLAAAGEALGLDLLDAAVLAVCAAPELNPRYGRLYAYLQDDVTRKLPSPRLVGHLLETEGVTTADVMTSFDQARPLRALGALRLLGDPQTPLAERPVKVADRLAAHLLGARMDELPQSRLRLVAMPAHDPGRDREVAMVRAVLARESALPVVLLHPLAGLGKTHLLHAIGHYVHHNYQHHEVRYVSTETFLNEFVDAIRTNTGNAFKRRYREIDVLLIDDIQFLENREGLQEEFFHTFNSLHGANKQIVISSDRMPDAIPTLEERLRGRFKWGLITDIQPPDLETRLAILRNKAERDQVKVPSEALEFIATKVSTNIRELEGALIRVTAFASLNHVPITIELAQHLLADLLRESTTPAAHGRGVAGRDRQHPRLRGRGPEGQEPAATAGDRSPDRHVRVP